MIQSGDVVECLLEFSLGRGLAGGQQVAHLHQPGNVAARLSQPLLGRGQLVLEQCALVLVHFQGRRASKPLTGVFIDGVHSGQVQVLYARTVIEV